MSIKITSPVFKDGGMIPPKYTCDGENISPPINWGNKPAGTKSIALICDDPDAPSDTWVHWVIYNIPPDTDGLDADVPNDMVLADGTYHGKNDWDKMGYGGPCPPSGIHRYFFKIFALDTKLELEPGATKQELLKAMQGHILSENSLTGKYKRN